jgi:hypothetical protein
VAQVRVSPCAFFTPPCIPGIDSWLKAPDVLFVCHGKSLQSNQCVQIHLNYFDPV